MNTTIYEKIENKGKLQVDEILEKARSSAISDKNKKIELAKKHANDRKQKIKNEYNKELQSKERLLDLEKRQSFLTIKQNIIKNIFDEVLERIESLDGKDLLDYVCKLIKNQEYTGNEIIYVNKNDYKKYLKALSTKNEGNLVDLDLLNKKLNTKFQLSNEPIKIKSGFLLEGKYYDLNFSFEDIINKIRLTKEQEIAEELFG